MSAATTIGIAMQERRDRILGEARGLLADGDPRAFSLRKLAIAAGVTVPTLYNLIGNRDAILDALVSEMIERIERDLDALEDAQPLEMAEAVVILATDAVAEDEDFHRAANLAVLRLSHDGALSQNFARHHDRCVEMQHRATRSAQRLGLLRGDIDARLLASQIYSNYQQASANWVSRTIDLAEFRSHALLGIYLCLAADAEEPFRTVLLDRIAGLSPRPDGKATSGQYV